MTDIFCSQSVLKPVDIKNETQKTGKKRRFFRLLKQNSPIWLFSKSFFLQHSFSICWRHHNFCISFTPMMIVSSFLFELSLLLLFFIGGDGFNLFPSRFTTLGRATHRHAKDPLLRWMMKDESEIVLPEYHVTFQQIAVSGLVNRRYGFAEASVFNVLHEEVSNNNGNTFAHHALDYAVIGFSFITFRTGSFNEHSMYL